jgi:hypothetical protein
LIAVWRPRLLVVLILIDKLARLRRASFDVRCRRGSRGIASMYQGGLRTEIRRRSVSPRAR